MAKFMVEIFKYQAPVLFSPALFTDFLARYWLISLGIGILKREILLSNFTIQLYVCTKVYDIFNTMVAKLI